MGRRYKHTHSYSKGYTLVYPFLFLALNYRNNWTRSKEFANFAITLISHVCLQVSNPLLLENIVTPSGANQSQTLF